MRTKLLKTIPFRPGTHPAQKAVTVWQALFDIYREKQCPLEHMHDMLLDFAPIRNMTDSLHGPEVVGVGILWTCSPGGRFTQLRMQRDWVDADPKRTIFCYNVPSDYVVKVTYSNYEVVLEEIDIAKIFNEAYADAS